jgi:hypothetical protein
LWYLPPIFAGGFFIVVTSVLSPYIPIAFIKESLPFSALTYAFVFALFLIFQKNPKTANAWAWIATAWVTVISIYVQSSLNWCDIVGC